MAQTADAMTPVPPRPIVLPEIDDDATVEAVIRLTIATSVVRLVDTLPLVATSDDTEVVHRARVATRRLRTALRTFDDYLDKSWRQRVGGDLAWLGDALGSVRDLDVLRDYLASLAQRTDGVPGEAVEPLLDMLADQRLRAAESLVEVAQSPRAQRVLDELVAAARQPVVNGRAQRPARRECSRVVRRRWKKLRKSVDRLGNKPSDHALHEVRIEAKRARYGAEAVEPVLGHGAARLALRLTAIQEVLGRHHDAVVAESYLAACAGAPDVSTESAFAAGVLLSAARTDASQAEAAFGTVWARAKRRKLRRFAR